MWSPEVITSNYPQIWRPNYPMSLIVSSIVGGDNDQNSIVNKWRCTSLDWAIIAKSVSVQFPIGHMERFLSIRLRFIRLTLRKTQVSLFILIRSRCLSWRFTDVSNEFDCWTRVTPKICNIPTYYSVKYMVLFNISRTLTTGHSGSLSVVFHIT